MTAAVSKRGFSLIEVLVALVVFALAAVALLNISTGVVRTTARLEDRALALIVAENLAVETTLFDGRLELGLTEGVDAMAGRSWAWRRVVTETDNPALLQVTLGVRAEGARQELASLVMFRRASRL